MTDTDLTEVVDRLRRAGCVYAEDEAALLLAAADSTSELDAMVERRIAGTPLELILGWVEFDGLRIGVEPGVFVPRRRTEILVREAARLIGPDSVVLDMCCGAGAVGAALAARIDGLELYAVDIDPVAVACARDNIDPLLGSVFEGDLFAPLPQSVQGRVDVIVANAPYVPTDAISLMPPEARLYEPHCALDGGADGTDIQRRIITSATLWLKATGSLLIETSRSQAATTQAAFDAAGFTSRVVMAADIDGTAVVGTVSSQHTVDPRHARVI